MLSQLKTMCWDCEKQSASKQRSQLAKGNGSTVEIVS